MGAAGMLIGGGVLGLGAASLMSKANRGNAYRDAASAFAAERPAVPEVPVPAEAEASGSATRNALMEAERERERQAALLRQQRAREVFTSALGAEGAPRTAKKTLLGG